MIAPKILSQKRESEADLKTSKLLLFAPVVEGCDQNYNHLKLFTVKRNLLYFIFPEEKQILHPVTDYRSPNYSHTGGCYNTLFTTTRYRNRSD